MISFLLELGRRKPSFRRLGQLPDEKPQNTMQKKYERRIRLRKIRESTGNSEKKDASKVLNALKDMGGKGRVFSNNF